MYKEKKERMLKGRRHSDTVINGEAYFEYSTYDCPDPCYYCDFKPTCKDPNHAPVPCMAHQRKGERSVIFVKK